MNNMFATPFAIRIWQVLFALAGAGSLSEVLVSGASSTSVARGLLGVVGFVALIIAYQFRHKRLVEKSATPERMHPTESSLLWLGGLAILARVIWRLIA